MKKNKKTKLYKIDRQSLKALAHSIRAGITPRDALLYIAGSKRGMAKVDIIAFADLFQFGISYSGAFEKTVLSRSPLFMQIIRISESNGQIAIALEMIVAHMYNSSRAKSQILGLSIYPIIVLLMTIAFLLFALLIIVPNIRDIISMPGVVLNPITKGLLYLSNTLIHNTFAVTGTLVCLIISILIFFRIKFVRNYIERLAFGLPLLSDLIKSYIFGAFAAFVALYVKFRSDIGTVFELMSAVTRVSIIIREFRAVADLVKKGEGLSVSLSQSKYIPQIWILFATVAERSSSYEEMFHQLASHHKESLDHYTKIYMKLLEPVLMISIGVMVGLLAYGILSPLYGLMNQIR